MLNVHDHLEQTGTSRKDAVAAIKEKYTGFDKQLLCKVENPDKYGVRLVNGTEQILEEAFTATTQTARRPEKRRLNKRVQCRMSETTLRRLQQAFRRNGFDTVQDGIAFIIDKYLEEQKNGTND